MHATDTPRFLTRLFLLFLLAAPLPALASLPRASSVPGGVAVVALGSAANGAHKPQTRFGERPVLVTSDNGQWYAVVGLPLDTKPGSYELRVQVVGKVSVQRFEVAAKEYPEQHITLKDKSKVDLSPRDQARVARELADITEMKHHWRDAEDTDLAFIMPVNGERGSAFGLRRFFNGEARLPHAGMDVVVARGTPVQATAAGRVLGAGEYFFNGNTVFVDHGNGLITMYCHLDRIDVHAGDSVTKGQKLGLSGMTGRATGPHLHWSVILNGAMVDPELFVPAQ